MKVVERSRLVHHSLRVSTHTVERSKEDHGYKKGNDAAKATLWSLAPCLAEEMRTWWAQSSRRFNHLGSCMQGLTPGCRLRTKSSPRSGFAARERTCWRRVLRQCSLG